MGCIPFTELFFEKPKANSTGTMDYFNYPLLHPHTTRTHSRKDGGYELEFISFFLLIPLAALLFLIIVAFTKKSRFLWGLLCLTCLLATALGALGLLPDWGKDNKLSAASGDVPASTVILLDDSLSMNAVESFSKAQDFISGFLENMHQQSETSILQWWYHCSRF